MTQVHLKLYQFCQNRNEQLFFVISRLEPPLLFLLFTFRGICELYVGKFTFVR